MFEAPGQSPKPAFGINLIGFASANLGLGVALRNTAGLLERQGIPFCVVDVDPGGNRTGHDGSLSRYHHDVTRPLPYPVNLFHLNPPELSLLLAGFGKLFDMSARLNACVPFWELPNLPPSWIGMLERMDVVLAPSYFIRHAVERQVSGVACRYYRQGLARLPEASADKARWGMAPDAVTFVCSFDAASDLYRKNPNGVLDAFANAFHSGDKVGLIVKINNQDMNPDARHLTALLKHLAGRMPHVRILDQALPYADVLGLYASADVYVSLHRGEGLGLGMLESMALGKPVIATDWSGNMDFMDDTCACLVPHRLIPVRRESNYFNSSEGVAQVWADASVDAAADWMIRLAGDATLRETLGAAARAAARGFIEASWKGEVFASLRAFYQDSWSRPVSWTPRADPAARPAPSVLMQNRDDMNSLPGGDTIVLTELRKSLGEIGINAPISLIPEPDLRDRDLVQLINITRSRDTLAQLRNANRQDKPVVLMPLYEDLDRYLVKATSLSYVYYHLAEKGKILPPEAMHKLATEVPLPIHPLDNETCRVLGIGDAENQQKILEGADHIVTSGSVETDLLRSKFRFSAPVTEIHFGIDPAFRDADGEAFRRKYGLKDFALCVGRLEVRKNQWTLIEIFRNLPDKQLVLIGFFELPGLEAAVRAFAPRNVMFLNRLPREELISAYAAARVHVLPSWYELPGLVSLEAAAAGCRIVTTSWGTARDYFQDRVHYCEPDSPESIRRAVQEAFDSELDPALRDYALETFDWKKAAARLRSIYEEVLDTRSRRPELSRQK